jgi:BirA family biotin operon repressor/biotin-[acetyl-CoA-carboxylase] ligase
MEGTVISTYVQTEGRGQIGASWLAEPGRNLSLSVILYPHFLAIRQQYLLNQTVALGVLEFIAKYSEKSGKIKWPNDIYAGEKKIAGILIQNTLSGATLQSSVIGVGVNVNQRVFSPELPNPTSLALETGRDHDLETLIDPLCRCLEARYLQLRAGSYSAIQADYLDRLYKHGEENTFYYPTGQAFRGRIAGVNEQGLLLIDKDDGQQEAFDLKAVKYR